ncbi:cadherin-like domain-containing protein [Puniceibacterium confluentis]|uniref:cadherin-like domain-containing protein n=1 Tax=Puniceibacterium confluentis TaxID=1958944 RepID=UPI0011B6F0BA|nr:cadherin-like domain-containing protein [Puniceibacterium confluentis]
MPIIDGTPDDDTLTGGPGPDTISGMAGNDLIYADDGDDLVHGGAGDDTISGGAGNDTLFGDEGNDLIYGEGGDDFLDGGDGDDTLDGGEGDDTLLGGAGNDSLSDSGGVVDISGGGGDDRITIYNALGGSIDGGAGRDVLAAYSGDISGLTITDVEVLETGGTQVSATAAQLSAFQTITVLDDPFYDDQPVYLQLVGGGSAHMGSALGLRGAYVTASDAGNGIVTGAGIDTLIGGAGNDLLDGGDGDDTLDGGEGDDTLLGGEGNDSLSDSGGVVDMSGGGGDDRITIYNALGGSIDGGSGRDVLAAYSGDISGLTITDVEVLETGGTQVSATAAQLSAFQTITVLDDPFYDDQPVYLRLVGGGTADMESALGVRAATVNASDAGIVVVTGAGNDTIIGSTGSDTLSGSAGDDELFGLGGGDRLIGGSGSDTVHIDGWRDDFVFTGTHDDFVATDTTRPGTPGDRLIGVEFVQFYDGLFSVTTFGFGDNTPPAVAGAVDLGASPEDQSRLVTAAELLAGTTDADGDTLTVTGLSVSAGTLVDHGDGTWTFTPVANDDSGVTFSYRVSDGQASVAQTATLDLTPANDAPVITSDGGGDTASVTVQGATTAVTTVAASDPDAGDILTFSITGGVDAAFFQIDTATGVLRFVAAPDFGNPQDEGGDNIYDVTVGVSDGNGGSDSQSIAVQVTEAAGILNTYGATVEGTIAYFSQFHTIRFSPAMPEQAVSLAVSDGGTLDLSARVGTVAAQVQLSDSSTEITGGVGDDTILGGAGNDTLWGGAGGDALNGGAGDDLLIGGAGADSYVGGSGIDTVDFSRDNAPPRGSDYGIAVDLRQGLLRDGYNNLETIASVENVVGTRYRDNFQGDDADNTFVGLDGTDTISGGGGDLLYGGDGDDIFLALPPPGAFDGNDLYDGGNGVDIIYLSGNVVVDLEAGTATGADMGQDQLVSIESAVANGGTGTILGSQVANTLGGSYLADYLDGRAGNDSLFGLQGDDTLIGGAGDDTLNGGAGADTAVYSGNRADYQVTLNNDGSHTIADLRAGTPDGTDTVFFVEYIRFANGVVSIGDLLNQPPVIVSDGGGDTASVTVHGNTTAVTTVAATDPDPGDTLSYLIAGGADAALFRIDGTTGALSFIDAPDFGTPRDQGATTSMT